MKRALYLFSLVALLTASGAFSQGQRSLEYDVKAAFLYNFTNFVDWPDNAFPSSNSPLNICILGRDPFNGALERVIQGEAAGSHPRLVQTMDNLDSLKTCHMVFVSSSEQARAAAVLDSLRSTSVLTVGESPEFLQAGGIINFAIERNRVRFDINIARADQSSLRISSKLLRLARSTRAER
jgi:hypothetical protein